MRNARDELNYLAGVTGNVIIDKACENGADRIWDLECELCDARVRITKLELGLASLLDANSNISDDDLFAKWNHAMKLLGRDESL